MDYSFDTLKLNNQIIEGLSKQQITTPTEIQAKVIPLALENKDIIGQSQTGSGKTLAYLLPLFEKIDFNKREMQALILTPTVELAMQVEKQISLLAINSLIPVTSTTIFGQVNIKRQIEKLKEKPHIIVGTPGRIHELIKLKKINSQSVKTLIIDEADRLLDKDNLNSLLDIIKTTLKTRQMMVFTASLNQTTINTAKELMNNPEIILVSNLEKMSTTISHFYISVEQQREKVEVLRKIISAVKPDKAIVFLNKSDQIQNVTEKLNYHHIETLAIFGTATKEERQLALQGFRNGKIQILVASDLASRGLDIENLTHIFNFDLPQDSKDYLHRVGRIGRMGKAGIAISIVTNNELLQLNKFEKVLKFKLIEKFVYKGELIDKKVNEEKNNT